MIHRYFGVTYFFIGITSFAMGACFFVIIMLLATGVTYPEIYLTLLPAVGVLSLGVYMKFLDLVPSHVEMDGTSVRYYEHDELVTEIAYDADVDVDALVNMFLQTSSHGALYGYSFSDGEDRIWISCDKGWRQQDVVYLWDLFIENVYTYDMKRGSGLKYVLDHSRQVDKVRFKGHAPSA